MVVNVENQTGPFGNVLYTVTLGPAIVPEEETGAHTIRGQAFSPDGGTVEFSGGGVWRTSGPNQRILKHITQLANGQPDVRGGQLRPCQEYGLRHRLRARLSVNSAAFKWWRGFGLVASRFPQFCARLAAVFAEEVGDFSVFFFDGPI